MSIIFQDYRQLKKSISLFFFPENCAPRECGLIDFRWNISIDVFQSCLGDSTVWC